MFRRKTASLIATLALAAGSVTWAVVAASSASACVADTDGDCYVSSYGYWNVQNTGSRGLAEHSSADINSPVEGSLPNGTAIEVHCQVNGTDDPKDGLPYTVWDRLENGYYVYDGVFVSSPGDGYHIVLNPC